VKHISVVTPCFNEEENIVPIYESVRKIFEGLDEFSYEHLFIDNASSDRTSIFLREIAAKDKNVKVILNSRNFGHIRSPYYALMQAKGEAVIMMACDFQDPPEMIPRFLEKWTAGSKIVVGVKNVSAESTLMFSIRKFYYRTANRLADIQLIENFTGFGLYEQSIIEILREIDDPYPYFRGLISEIGFDVATIPFTQPHRHKGITKNNFYTLFDIAMLGFTNHSKIPLRLAAMVGFLFSILSLLAAIAYFVAKLIFWDFFSAGIAPLLISIFFFSAVQLFFIGVLGEYVGAIHTQTRKRPLVIEKERINFEIDNSDPPL
jgi:polyisoprenyl-phosphate glycosyltransferase